MADPAAQTTQMVDWLDRMRAGDAAARDELIRGFQGRLEMLARKMVGRDRRVARWVDAEDVLQNALLRLLRALETIQPNSTRAFFGLAAEQIRRELLDLARHYYGLEGEGANHDSVGARPDDSRPVLDPPAPDSSANDLERWTRFHEEVERLPARRARSRGPDLLPRLDPGPGGRAVSGRRADRPTLVGCFADPAATGSERGSVEMTGDPNDVEASP